MKKEIKSLRNPHFYPKPVKPVMLVKDFIVILSALTEDDKNKPIVVHDYEYGVYHPIDSINKVELSKQSDGDYVERIGIDKRKIRAVIELGI